MSSTVIEFLLCLILGWLGAHRFYRRKWGTAILWLLTGGIFGIGWLVDLILVFIRMIKEQNPPTNNAPVNNAPETDAAPPVYDPVYEPVFKSDTTPQPDLAPEIKISKAYAEPAYKPGKTYKVAGVSYCEDNILELACENTDYKMTKKQLVEEGLTEERIWKYEFYPSKTELIPEPDNPQDPNAIKVVVDGYKVGYIKSGSVAHLKKLLNAGGCKVLSCEIGGGPYKYLEEDDEEYDVYNLEKGNTNFFCQLRIDE